MEGRCQREGVEIPEKVEIESEWAEWQTGLAEQQAYAEIDPKPGKMMTTTITTPDSLVIRPF